MQSQLQQAEKEYQGHILKSLGVIKEASNSFKKVCKEIFHKKQIYTIFL